MKAGILLIGGIMLTLTASYAHGQDYECKSEKCSIVQIGDPILQKHAREPSKEEILSQQIQEVIEKMKRTIQGIGVGLAAPQIGYPLQLAVIEDTEEFHKMSTPELILEREREIVPFHVIINPKITLDESEYVEFFEGCLSMDGYYGIVPRARRVRVECLNEKAEPITIEAKGWYARILQHEIDHLMGKMFINCVHVSTLTNKENYNAYWRNLSMDEVYKQLNSQ